MVVERRSAKCFSKQEIFKSLCNHRSEENRIRHNAIHNQTNKVVVARARRMEGDTVIEAFSESQNKIFKFLNMMKRRK